MQDPAEKIIVALDCDMERAIELAELLRGHATWMKVGMTLYYSEGPRAVRELKDCGFKVFLDLKLHDIPHQVHGAAKAAVLTGADMITVHASGGAKMISEAVEGAREAVSEMPDGAQLPAILAVTVLTSMDDAALASIGVDHSAAEQVERLALLARRAGASGVVASPLEAKMLRDVLGPEMLIVTPGVRPAGSASGDQARVTTPSQAFENGSTHVVIGRPITQARDPLSAFDSIAAEIEELG
ncbi:MAG: orotidine-5'-phosphate decarboxylase [Coriobacteriales bacterium]|jgi:orotidine-5'-phosphate decarboxylase